MDADRADARKTAKAGAARLGFTKSVDRIARNLEQRERPRLGAALILAFIADALQIVVFPLFVAGIESPADDILDLGMGAVLTYLLGWHWEFLPSFLGKLVPGVDLVPLWTLAVANVYRKSKQLVVAQKGIREERSVREDPRGM